MANRATRGLACIVVVVGMLAQGCGAAVTRSQAPAKPAQLGVSEASFSEVLATALDEYEADVRQASARWYPNYTVAYQTSQRLIEPDFQHYVGIACEARGVSVRDLDEYASAHPGFVSRQNDLFSQRISAIRPAAFSIMGRISPELTNR